MSKGGDTTTTETTSSYPEYVDPYVEDYLAQAQDVTDNSYQAYEGERLAEFSDDTEAAFDMIRDEATSGDSAALTTAIDTATGVANYDPTSITSNNVTAGTVSADTISSEDVSTMGANEADIKSYMDPYVKEVVDSQTKAANQNYAEQQAGRDADAVAAGAFGGDRRFVQDSLATRDLNDQLNALTAQGYSDAYNQATALYEQDAARALDASKFNSSGQLTADTTNAANRLNAGEFNVSTALTADTGNADRALSASTANEDARRLAASLNLDASETLSAQAQQEKDMAYQDAEALSAVGEKEQQRDQAALDLAYQDFVDQQNWDADQTQLYGELLGVVTGSSGQDTTTTTTGQSTDWLSAIVGLGTAVAGAAV